MCKALLYLFDMRKNVARYGLFRSYRLAPRRNYIAGPGARRPKKMSSLVPDGRVQAKSSGADTTQHGGWRLHQSRTLWGSISNEANPSGNILVAVQVQRIAMQFHEPTQPLT